MLQFWLSSIIRRSKVDVVSALTTKMPVRVWAESKDKRFKWVTLSTKYLPGALNVMRNSFYVNETVSKVTGIANSDKAMKQFDSLLTLIAEDGISVVAIEVESDTVVGVALNKIQVKGDPSGTSFLEKQMKIPDIDPAFEELLNLMMKMEEKVDIFKHYKVTKIVDHMFLTTHIDYYQKGIGRGLVAATVDMARALNRGEDVAVPISDDRCLLEDKPPKVQAVIALFTSPISQRIGKSLQWDEIVITSYDQLFYRGESYASRLDENNQTIAYMSIKIEN